MSEAVTSFTPSPTEQRSPRARTAANLPVRVITPHSGLEGFKHAVASLVHDRDQALHLAWRFFVRDTSAAYRQSLLGYVWLLLPPLANTLVWVFLNGSGVVQIDTGSVSYPIFVLSGTILWAGLNGGLMATLSVISDARSILSKINFPHEALAYSAALKALLEAGIPLLVLLPALLLLGVGLSPAMLLFPVALLGCVALGLAVGLIVLPVAALYTDVGRGMQFALRFGFFATPVIYALPESGVVRSLMLLNPATPLIVTGRDWLTASGEGLPLAFALVSGASVMLIALGLVLLKVAVPFLVERVGG